LRWLDDDKLWEVEVRGGKRYRARFVINASGPLSTPVIPAFKGRERFAGASFHTNDWDHSFDYRGKRVAIIGSGASAAQVIPAIAGDVAELHVFQRTPHWVLPRPDHVFSALERQVLKRPLAYKALRASIYASLELRVVGMKYSQLALKLLAQRDALRHLRDQVADPVMRRQLTPDFTIGCKRVILSTTLYPALCLPTTTLHTGDRGVAEIDARGIVTTDGARVDVDAIVYATGYDATDGVISYPVVGRGGHSVADAWREFPRAYLGTTLPNLPNLFLVTGPNTGIGHTSALFIIESQMNYIMDAIATAQAQGYRSVEVTERAEAEYTDMIHREMRGTVWESGGCDSWYKSKSGKVIAMFPGFSFTFRHLARRMNRAHHRLTR
jgi:cation diffusion facilitator CzcD-associated flavoprotein CzcO